MDSGQWLARGRGDRPAFLTPDQTNHGAVDPPLDPRHDELSTAALLVPVMPPLVQHLSGHAWTGDAYLAARRLGHKFTRASGSSATIVDMRSTQGRHETWQAPEGPSRHIQYTGLEGHSWGGRAGGAGTNSLVRRQPTSGSPVLTALCPQRYHPLPTKVLRLCSRSGPSAVPWEPTRRGGST